MRQICPGPGEPGLVSIVIPTYNRAHVLAETLDSALAQTYRPIEIIVVDDGSTDGTRALVEAYGDRIHYIHQPNAGVPTARNTGFGAARGEFIALLDSDDRWWPWKLEAQIAFLRAQPQIGMVWTDMRAITNDGTSVAGTYLRTFYTAYQDVRVEDMMTPIGVLSDLDAAIPAEFSACPMWVGDIFPQLIRGTLVHTPTTLLRRERVHATGGYDETLRPNGEDFDFHLRTAAIGPVGFLDAPTIDYRIGNDDQLTAPTFGLTMARHYMRTVDYWLQRERDRITLPAAEIRRILAYGHAWTGSQELLMGDRAAARRHLWQSVRRVPTRPRVLALLLFALLPPQVLGLARSVRRRRHSVHAHAG